MTNTGTLRKDSSLQNGKYLIEEVLGQGGFGITYLAYFKNLRKKVAIKEYFMAGCVRTDNSTVLPQSLPPDQFIDFKTRFLNEAANIASFNHHNIVRVTDIFEENNTAYFVMNFVEGQTLKQIVEVNGKLSEISAINIIQQIAEALLVVHNNQMLHRDVKPENIIIESSGNAVLIDFGAARHFVAGKTITQTAILTPGYAPIEQYSEKRKRGSYTDIYSLGATFYFLLTAQKPLPAPDRLAEATPEPKSLNSAISHIVNSTILKAIEFNPVDRYQNISEFLSALKGDFTPEPPPNREEPSSDATLILDKDSGETQVLVHVEENKTQILPQQEEDKTHVLLQNAEDKTQILHQKEDDNHAKPPQELFPKPAGRQGKKGLLIAVLSILIMAGGITVWYFINENKKQQQMQAAYELAIERGDSLFSAKDFRNAVSAYEAALEMKANDPIASEKQQQATDSITFYYNKHIAKGDTLKAIPNYTEARDAYNEALELKPEDAIAKAKLNEVDSLLAIEAAAKAKAKEDAELKKFAGKHGTFIDSRDGKTYKCVRIGTQEWMAENLNYETSSGSWCYDNDNSNCNKYGRLYVWEAANNAAPSGWHLPTDEEWNTLVNYLGGQDVAGGKLKSTTGWNSPNTGASNSSGFTGLPGGYRYYSNGSFGYLGDNGCWWSATEYDASGAWYRRLFYDHADLDRGDHSKSNGFSVRCLKD